MSTHPIVLLSHPSIRPLADRIVAANISRGSTRGLEYWDNVHWGQFPDGFPDLFIEDIKLISGKEVILLLSFHSPSVIFEQVAVLYALPRYVVKSLKVILPYFPTGTMERVDKEGQIATAKTLAKMLSNVALTQTGPAQLIMFDIHALQERFYFNENIIPRLATAIPVLLQRLRLLPQDQQSLLSIVYPDDGAFKRFNSLFEAFPPIICNKIREGSNRIIKIKEGEVSGRNVVIVDDLVQTGGTLIECAKAVRAAGANHCYAFVTHAVFPNESWRKFKDGVFDIFWHTDSCPLTCQIICNESPFEMLSLSTPILDLVLAD